MTVVKYIKSFSSGQVTIPKEFRESLGIGDDFWLKLSLNNGNLIAEPVQEVRNKATYKQDLAGIKSVIDLKLQVEANRKELEQQITARSL